MLLPRKLAEQLGLSGGSPISVQTSIGMGTVLDAGVSISVEVEGRRAEALVRRSDEEVEVIANDALIEELGIVILRPRTGTYRFMEDPPNTERSSVEPVIW